MKASLALFTAALLFISCKEENITQILGPEDWQGPIVEWHYQPDAELRGTVGIDVSVSDSSAVAWVRMYLDGQAALELIAPPYRFEFDTDTLADGVHVAEVRAQDEYGNLGISPILRVNIMNSFAQGSRVIWVPDSFATIQAAINAATDFDTIRVRDGEYVETICTFDKGLWIESFNGPLVTTIDGNNTGSVLYVPHHQIPSTLRGFSITGGNTVIGYDDGAQLNLYNNIVFEDSAWTLLISGQSSGEIHNNLFTGSEYCILIGYHWGTLYNNIIQYGTVYGLWNASAFRNPIVYGYNLFWHNAANYYDFEAGIGDIDSDPMLDLVNAELIEGSPAVNSGYPSIFDLDSTRSDIGPFGGPWAY